MNAALHPNRGALRAASQFRPDIEGVRAIAVTLVVAFHAVGSAIPGGFIGVDIFFAISGYLISGLLLAEIERTGRIDLAGFYARRVRRLLPAAFTMLVVTLGIGCIVLAPVEQMTVARTARAMSLYLSNYWFFIQSSDYFAADTHTNPLLHTWSLAVEEQFYMLWPLLLIGLHWSCSARRQFVLALTALTLASFACCVWTSSVDQSLAFYGLHTRAWEFGVGALARLLPDLTVARNPRAFSLLAWAGLAVVLLSAFLFNDKMLFPGWLAAVPVLGTSMLLAANTTSHGNPIGIVLGSRLFQVVGRHSYSWYLWHWPVLVYGRMLQVEFGALSLLLATALGLAAAAASLRFVEDPLRRLPLLARTASASFAFAVLLIVAGIAIALGTRAAGSYFAAQPLQVQVTEAAMLRPAENQHCHLLRGEIEPTNCAFGDRESATEVVLFGDSHALQWLPALDVIGARRHWRVRVATKSGCAAAEIPPPDAASVQQYAECSAWRTRQLQQIAALRPMLVVVASRSPVGRLGIGGAAVPAAQRARLNTWRRGYRHTLSALNAIGGPVLLIQDMPRPPFNASVCLSRAIQRGALASVCNFTITAGGNAPTHKAEAEAASGLSFVVPVDLRAAVCPRGSCTPQADGVVVFRDDSHISVAYARVVAPQFERELNRLLKDPASPKTVSVGPGQP